MEIGEGGTVARVTGLLRIRGSRSPGTTMSDVKVAHKTVESTMLDEIHYMLRELTGRIDG